MNYANNTIFNILAILGALAWMPFIIQLIREKIKKPKLKIFSENQIEIGYTSLGPILNIDLAFLAQNKSALVDKITLELIHKSQERQNFVWIWFEESLLQMELPKTPIKYKKNQKAIALNVQLDTLIEKKIGFQSALFKSESEKIIKNLYEDRLNLGNSGKNIEEIKSYSNYNNAMDYAGNSFPWKIGVYKANFTVHISETNISFSHSFNFEISNLDVKVLHKNIDIIKASFENAFIKQNEELTPEWEWVHINKLSQPEEV